MVFLDNLKLQVKVLDGFLPCWKSHEDAGLDLQAAEDVYLLKENGPTIVRLGIATAFSPMYVASIRDRSGLASKGLHTLAGVVDSSYRGEWKAVMVNIGYEPIEIKRGDRVAQVLFQPVFHLMIEEVKELPETIRGVSGFGASGR